MKNDYTSIKNKITSSYYYYHYSMNVYLVFKLYLNIIEINRAHFTEI